MSGEVKTFREYLACDVHGDRNAENACGECGKPICEECATEVHDATFTHFETTGFQTLGAAAGLVIGVPLLLYVIAPGLLQFFNKLLFPGKIVPLRSVFVQSSILLGLALLPSIWYRSGDGSADFTLLVRRGNDRIVCEECHDEKKSQNRMYYAVTGVAALLGLLGLYVAKPFLGGSVSGLYLMALGGATYVLRDEAVVVLAERLEAS